VPEVITTTKQLDASMLTIENRINNPMNSVLKRCPSPEMETWCALEMKKAKKVRPRKKVTFFSIVAIKAHDHFLDMTPEEITGAWYQREQYTQMKQNCIPALRLMLKGQWTGDTDDMCARGLESHHSSQRSNSRKQNKLKAVYAVLKAQEKESAPQPVHISEKIRNVYLKVSESSRKAASERGQEDGAEARSIHDADLLMDPFFEDSSEMMLCDSSMSDDITQDVEEDPELCV
jgi:hypothetical protein